MANVVRRILVPTDFSRASEQTLDHARALARQFDASLHMLHVVNRPLLAEGLAAEAFIAEGMAIGSDLAKAAEVRLRTLAPEATSADVVFGSAARSIVDYASRLDIDLIVMGSHGRSGIAHVLLGSVAAAVVRTASCPVLTVRGRAKDSERLTSRAELDAMTMFARILVPTDFSAPSEAALTYGRGLAKQYDAALHLIHIAENSFLRAAVADRRSLEDAARRWLQDRLTDDDRRRGTVAIVERSDEPATEILQYAKSANIDLIVMGTHGRTGLARVVMGSAAEAVVRAAPCPVLTVHSAESAALAAAGEGA